MIDGKAAQMTVAECTICYENHPKKTPFIPLVVTGLDKSVVTRGPKWCENRKLVQIVDL
jgi:hypothetical protein